MIIIEISKDISLQKYLWEKFRESDKIELFEKQYYLRDIEYQLGTSGNLCLIVELINENELLKRDIT